MSYAEIVAEREAAAGKDPGYARYLQTQKAYNFVSPLDYEAWRRVQEEPANVALRELYVDKAARLTAIIRAMLVKYGVGPDYTADEINCGTCEEFAESVCELFPEAFAFWDDELREDPDNHDGHKFIMFNGRAYDSEAPEGVDDWRDLPYFLRCRAREQPA